MSTTPILIGDEVIVPAGKFEGAQITDLPAVDLRWLRWSHNAGSAFTDEIETEFRRRVAVRERSHGQQPREKQR